MDETLRRLEREAHWGDAAGAGGTGRLRLGREYLRAGRADDALALTDGAPDDGPLLALRAEVLLGLQRIDDALAAAQAAARRAPGALPVEVATALGRSLLARAAGDGVARLGALRACADLGDAAAPLLAEVAAADGAPLARAQAARVTALAPLLRDDPSPLVRFLARGGVPGVPSPRPPLHHRIFGGRSPDFETGTFVAFDAPLEERLAYFETALFREVERLLVGPGRTDPSTSTWLVACDPTCYGLGIPGGQARGDVEGRAERVNASRALPFPLRVHSSGRQFYDLTGDSRASELAPDDESLAHELAEDLRSHAARFGYTGTTLDARLTGLFQAKRRAAPPPVEDLAPLLDEARATFGPVGVRAVLVFVEDARAQGRRPAR